MQQTLTHTQPDRVRLKQNSGRSLKKTVYYKEIKKFLLQELSHRGSCLVEEYPCPEEWAKMFYPLILDCVQQEDYEGAQAAKDAILEFLNFPAGTLLDLP